MVRLFSLLALVVGMILSLSLPASAQIKEASDTETADVDVAGIAEVVLDADPDALLEGLEEPPDDRVLPEGFFNPPSGVPENAEVVESFAFPIDDLPGAIGSFSHPFDTDPDVIDGLLSAGIINYIVLEDEITEDDLDDFEEGASGGFDDGEAGLTGAVDRVEVAGEEAVVIAVELDDAGIFGAVQIIALPVGNTMVFGTALVVDTGEVDLDTVYEHAEALTLAGVTHLEAVAEDAA